MSAATRTAPPPADAPDEAAPDEAARLARLEQLGLIGTGAEAIFDTLARLAAEICEAPIALVSLVDADRQWFKANTGLTGITETPRDVAFCAHAIQGAGIMEVEDATQDSRFAANPLVTGAPDIRFYAGAPITLSDDTRLGTLCVIDRHPRKLNAKQRAMLTELAAAVSTAIESRESTRNALAGRADLEHELLASLRRNHVLAASIDACPIAINITSLTAPGFPVIYANPMYLTLTGFRAAEIIGQPCRHLNGLSIEPQQAAALRETVLAGQQTEIELTKTRKDGTRFLSRLTLAPVPDERGALTACIGLQADITEEAQRRDANKYQRDKLAAIGRSMGGIAHEINNMLQPVTLLAQELIDQNLILPAGARHIEVLLESARQARHILGDLLAFSRPAGPSARTQDLAALLNDSAAIARQSLPPSIALELRRPRHKLLAVIDPTKFTQILVNLIKNAATAMDGAGQLTVTLDETSITPPGANGGIPLPHARLRVADTGCGMDADTLDRAFEPFFTTKPIGQGTGLGLPLVYALVRESGGIIRLNSSPGLGTTVTVLLPCVKEID